MLADRSVRATRGIGEQYHAVTSSTPVNAVIAVALCLAATHSLACLANAIAPFRSVLTNAHLRNCLISHAFICPFSPASLAALHGHSAHPISTGYIRYKPNFVTCHAILAHWSISPSMLFAHSRQAADILTMQFANSRPLCALIPENVSFP